MGPVDRLDADRTPRQGAHQPPRAGSGERLAAAGRAPARTIRSAVGGDRGDDWLRDVPWVHEQGAGDLAAPGPPRDQRRLAVAPGGELVLTEALADGGAEPPCVASVVPPGGQTCAQLFVAERGP